MKFIVIEGLDGSGKSTQIRLVEKFFREKQIKSKFIHFPRQDSPIYGELINRFLRGELGNIDTVNPYLIALIYAGDRKDAAKQLLEWMASGYMVIADRYLYSNIAFQCAKLLPGKQRDELAMWIKHLEYNYNNIPVPDLNLFLDVPFGFTRKSLSKERKGEEREYLNGGIDIHESDLSFQEKVREIYRWQVEQNTDFESVDCSNKKGQMLTAEEISDKILGKIKEKLIVD
jgi:dTMP kinase